MSNCSIQQIYDFLCAVDGDFVTPLSKKQDLMSLAKKFYEKATVCTVVDNEEIQALVAGYTKNLINNQAYISVVATLPSARGNGYASLCMKEFLNICEAKNIESVHLYTDKTNFSAIAMYKKLGFVDYICENEQRTNDLHLIRRNI